MGYKKIAGQVPTFMALGLLGENVRYAKKKGKRVAGMIGMGLKNIVGVSIITPVANIVKGL